jgi:small subunit ribosomal protein S20
LATHKSAEKRNRQNKKRNLKNSSIKSKIKTSAKKVLGSIAMRDKAASEATLKAAVSIIDKAASKGTLHKNTAARKISRLTKKVNALGA